MPVIVVYNPVCGDRTGKAFFEDHVLPFLAKQEKRVDLVVETEYAGHAGKAVAHFAQIHANEPISVVLGSGDGTLHEIVNELYFKATRRVSISLVPCGTANALYSSLFPASNAAESVNDVEYRLQSLRNFALGATRRPLSLAVTQVNSSEQPILSAVVTSTSLHAAILHYSESLRQEYPGLERFKIAAEQNSTKWFRARACLLPSPAKTVPEIYNPETKSFVPASREEGPLDLNGPFAYFLATVNVDRLEPTFCITPLSRSIPPPADTCDVVVIRPLRDPSVLLDSPETRQQFVSKTWAAMMAAYKEGAHVDLQYNDKDTLVEYYRCGGWEWHPESDDDDAHLICSDGAISRLEKNAWAESRVSTGPEDRLTVDVYAP